MAWPGGEAPPAPAAGSRFRDLTVRAAAGAVLAGLAIGAILLGAWGVIVLTALALGAAGSEWRRLINRGLPRDWAIGGAIYLIVAALSFCYIYFGPDLSNSQELGGNSLFWFLAIMVANDCFAYGVGRTVGGPRLAPRVSPKKTWSGTLGGLAASGVAAAAVGWALGAASPMLLGLAGLLLSALAQVGDLAESWLKRLVGVKDAGTLIPGHGGVLDRVDGIAAAAIALALAQAVTWTPALRW